MNFDSFYKPYANQTLKWLQTDSEESYNKHLKEKYDQLKTNGWIGKEITYTFNSHGFRCKEFDSDRSIMFLGCSFTAGIGLPLETIWPELVAKEFGMDCANLGIGGGAADTAFRLCMGYLNVINPKAVVYLPPPGVRVELELEDKMIPINVYSYKCNDYNVLIRQFFKLWLIGETNNDYFNRAKNLLAMKYLCSEANIPFVELSMDNMPSIDWARDLGHDGVESNAAFSKYAINEIKKVTNW